jgi:hypothetical protein
VNVLFRRVFAGDQHADARLVRDERDFPHYETREPPRDVPPGAIWTVATMDNLDGGPGLRNRIAVLDQQSPHLAEDARVVEAHLDAFCAAPALVAEIHLRLGAWGALPLETIIWTSPRLRIDGLVGNVEPDALGWFRDARSELPPGSELWPPETDDGYGTRIRIPDALVGTLVADAPDPSSLVEDLRARGIVVERVSGDHAILVLW